TLSPTHHPLRCNPGLPDEPEKRILVVVGDDAETLDTAVGADDCCLDSGAADAAADLHDGHQKYSAVTLRPVGPRAASRRSLASPLASRSARGGPKSGAIRPAIK